MNEIVKVLLRLWVEIKISLTQKDTMDRGSWIKIQKEGKQEDSKGDKSPQAQKMQNGMGMRNKRIYLFTICYDPVVSKLEATQRQR